MRLICLSLLILAASVALRWAQLPFEIPGTDGRFVSVDDLHDALVLFGGLLVLEALVRIIAGRKAVLDAARVTELSDVKAQLELEIASLSDSIRQRESSLSSSEASIADLRRTLDKTEKMRGEEANELRVALKNAEEALRRTQQQNSAQGRDVLHFISRLQEKGRFLDFVMEEIGTLPDQQVGSAARFVHDGCKSVVREYVELSPLQSGEEGKQITISAIEDAGALRFIGRSASEFPVTGTLLHRGWKATKISIPTVTAPPESLASWAIISPAEIELR